MLKFNFSIFALVLSPILLSAQTPKPPAGEAAAKSSRGGVITGRVTDSQGQPVVEEPVRVNKLDSRGGAQPFYVVADPDMYMTDVGMRNKFALETE